VNEILVTPSLPFVDLQAQRARIDATLRARIDAVLAHGKYILGPEVAELERRLGEFTGAHHVVGCANGTDALVLALRALGVLSGDAVLVPSFTFCATAEAVALVGATPVFIDVDAATFNVNAASMRAGVSFCQERGLRLVGAIAVDLFGLPAPYRELRPVADAEGLWLLADAAQSIGAEDREGRVGSLTRTTTASFFPAKPLGCYGDGGAVLTTDAEMADSLRSLRVHGQGTNKYDNVRIGYNSRLDTVQAAVLLAKLDIFSDELSRRKTVAERYATSLGDVVRVPVVADGVVSAWAQYTITLQPGQRDIVAEYLGRTGIPTAVYYAVPLHEQTAYQAYPAAGDRLPVSEDLAGRVLSLPMHPYLETDVQDRIVAGVRDALTGRAW
jgi:dTDP-4-amino-4,6-dideoxygalactose transaminase